MLEALRRAAASGGIDASVVQQALKLRSLYMAERMLAALRAADGRFDSAEEFVAAAEQLMAADPASKLEFLFKLHDEDGDGFIQRHELERMLHIAAVEDDLRLSDAEVNDLLSAIMDASDANADGRIGLIELLMMMADHPFMQQRLAEYGVSLLMPGKRAKEQAREPSPAWRGWMRNELVLSIWLIGYVAANAWLFIDAFVRYRDLGAHLYVQIARGCGACLNFNCALIALPMLRHTLTWVRRSALGRIVPVDDAVSLHALVGEVSVGLALVHTGAHVLNVLRIGSDPWSRANVTGAALLLVMLVMWLCSRPFVRRSGRFELFHVTHVGYVTVVALLFVHGPHFWIWGTVPWLWFFVERALRARRRGVASRVSGAKRLASHVTRVDVERPFGFNYAPGDYVFLRLPSIARHEWHPFTLTSAPEDPERLTVHMRSAGNWTSAVRERVTAALSNGQEVLAHIDGPYGTASRHVLDVPHAVAIAGGIGVTPFASILESLFLRKQDPQAPPIALRKLHFIWLNRDQHSFEWFRDLLVELEKRDQHKLLDIHIFMTAGRADMAGGVLEFARHLVARRTRGDLVTGLRTHISMGAPDFDRLLQRFCQDPDLPRPQVFFCGPPALERVVDASCHRLDLRFRSERF